MAALTDIGAALSHIQETREELGALHSFIASAAHNPQGCSLDYFLAECRRRILRVGSRERDAEPSLSSLDGLISEVSTRYLADSAIRATAVFGDLASQDVARLLPLVFVSARSVEQALERKLSRLEKQVEETLSNKMKMSSGAKKDELLGEELKRNLTGSTYGPITSLILPFQSFASRTASDMLCSVLEKSPRLVVVDLSHCLLGDQIMGTLLTPLSTLQKLACLILKNNAFTAAVTPMFLRALNQDGPSSSFPALRGLALDDNSDMPQADVEAIQSTLRQAQERRIPRKSLALPSEKVLVFDAPCMRAAAIAECLHLSSSTEEMVAIASKFDVFCGSSFSAVVAVAVAMMIQTDLIVQFFRTLAKTVFATTPYLGIANHAGRMMRDWWSAGNFYSAAALRSAFAELFTEALLKLPFSSFSNLLGKRILLYGSSSSFASEVSNDPQPICFRSWVDDHDGTLSEKGPSLEDVLLACCATSTYFAPKHIAPLHGPSAVACVDLLYAPLSSVAAELLPLLEVGGTKSHMTVLTISNASEDRSFLAAGNPFVSLALAACLSVAPKRGKHGTPPSTLVTSLRQKVEITNVSRLSGVGFTVSVKPVLLPGRNCDDVALDEGDERVLFVGLQNKIRKLDLATV